MTTWTLHCSTLRGSLGAIHWYGEMVAEGVLGKYGWALRYDVEASWALWHWQDWEDKHYTGDGPRQFLTVDAMYLAALWHFFKGLTDPDLLDHGAHEVQPARPGDQVLMYWPSQHRKDQTLLAEVAVDGRPVVHWARVGFAVARYAPKTTVELLHPGAYITRSTRDGD